MSSMGVVRLVVKDYVRREDLDRAAQQQRWIFRKEVPAGDRTPYHRIWLTADRQVGIAYCEDALIEVRYLEVRSPEPEAAVKRLAGLIDTYNSAEIQGLLFAAQAPEQWVAAVHKAAMAAPRNFDPQYFKLFERAFAHPDAGVRRSAIEAAAYVKWREFEKVLVELDKRDAQVGRDAALMLQAMRMYHWREQG